MDHSMNKLFWENPYIHEKLYEFCKTIPEHEQAKQAYEALAEEIDRHMGRKFYLAYEQALNDYIVHELHAYYLFGLGLRQEVLSALN